MPLSSFDRQQKVLRRQRRRAREVLEVLVKDANWDPNAVEGLLHYIFDAPWSRPARLYARDHAQEDPMGTGKGVN